MPLNVIINYFEFEKIQHIICPIHSQKQWWWLYTIFCIFISTSPMINFHISRQFQSLHTRKIHQSLISFCLQTTPASPSKLNIDAHHLATFGYRKQRFQTSRCFIWFDFIHVFFFFGGWLVWFCWVQGWKSARFNFQNLSINQACGRCYVANCGDGRRSERNEHWPWGLHLHLFFCVRI